MLPSLKRSTSSRPAESTTLPRSKFAFPFRSRPEEPPTLPTPQFDFTFGSRPEMFWVSSYQAPMMPLCSAFELAISITLSCSWQKACLGSGFGRILPYYITSFEHRELLHGGRVYIIDLYLTLLHLQTDLSPIAQLHIAIYDMSLRLTHHHNLQHTSYELRAMSYEIWITISCGHE